ncbi:uncharacterized protein LOC107775693 [Nicotiana tabacum]|uniref:uncharacterized protein LOC107775693 n=1 Tax=Nicotiana tabacum TaxID=4097 RepID=UPI003F4F34DD
MNSVAKGFLGGIMYASSAQTVWEDLAERFNKVDGSRTFNLHKEIATLTQGSASLSVYFSKLKALWEEFEALVPAPGYDCPKSRDFVNYLLKLRLYQFLMGLNDSYSQARSQILMKSPLPTVNQAYALIVSDKSQRSIAANSGILGANPVGNFEVAMYNRNGGGGQNQRFKKNFNIQCEYCKLKGHTKENCYKLVGYPQDFRQKKRGYNAAHNANILTENYNNQNQNPTEPTFTYGQNTNVINQSACGNQVSYNQGLEAVASQLGNYTFTKNQYDQIVQLLKKGGISTITNNKDSAANVTGSLHWEGERDW